MTTIGWVMLGALPVAVIAYFIGYWHGADDEGKRLRDLLTRRGGHA